jgi:hypothetical protein
MKRVLVSLTSAVALAAGFAPAVASSSGTPVAPGSAPPAAHHDGPCPFANATDV